MKKLLVAFLSVCVSLSFAGCSLLYQLNAIDNFDIGYSKVLNEAFVSSYNWDGVCETKNIVIPEEYNGIKITALGGYYGRGAPHPFGVSLSESYKNDLCSEANQWFGSKTYKDVESVDTVYLNFNLHISKNIEQITEHTLDHFYEGTYYDGENYHSKIIVVILYNITCDEDNNTFYAKDGKLYYRQNDSLVSDILYFDHEFES